MQSSYHIMHGIRLVLNISTIGLIYFMLISLSLVTVRSAHGIMRELDIEGGMNWN